MRAAVAALACALAALGTHPAAAGRTDPGCGYDTVAQETVTGGPDRFAGVAYGRALSDGPARLRCIVTVDGRDAAVVEGPESSGLLVAAGGVAFDAGDGQVVDVCWEVVTAGGTTRGCRVPCYGPPEGWCGYEEVFALLDTASAALDATVCPAAGALAPGAGPVGVTPEGDVTLSGEPWWDCPPYGA